MRYLATCDRFFHDLPGGGYRVAWELARLAASQGHEVALLCGSTASDPPAVPDCVQGVTVVRYRFPDVSSLDPRRLSAHVAAARSAMQRFLPGRWDVVHSHMLASGSAAFAEAGSGEKVATIHSPAVLEQAINWNNGTFAGFVKRTAAMPLLKRAEGRLYAEADRLITLSEFTAMSVARIFGETLRAKLTILPWWSQATGFGLERSQARRSLKWPEGVPLLYTLRRMVPRMGLDVLVSALEALSRRGRPFFAVLAGDGPERGRLMRRVAEGPARDRVLFPGRLTEEEVMLAYAAADLFVLPTRALECFGIIAVEAFAAGCPVVASEVGAISEVVGPVFPEGLFESGRVEELGKLLERILAGELTPPPAAVLRRYAQERFGQEHLGSLWATVSWGAPASRRDERGEAPHPADTAAWRWRVREYPEWRGLRREVHRSATGSGDR